MRTVRNSYFVDKENIVYIAKRKKNIVIINNPSNPLLNDYE